MRPEEEQRDGGGGCSQGYSKVVSARGWRVRGKGIPVNTLFDVTFFPFRSSTCCYLMLSGELSDLREGEGRNGGFGRGGKVVVGNRRPERERERENFTLSSRGNDNEETESKVIATKK